MRPGYFRWFEGPRGDKQPGEKYVSQVVIGFLEDLGTRCSLKGIGAGRSR